MESKATKMSRHGNKGKYKGNGNKSYKVGDQAKATLEGIDENNAVIQCFKKYAKKLDEKHDKYERLVKLSRDITIESKRIIFLLHSINRESKRTAVLEEAKARLEVLISKNWKIVAKELYKEDPFLYHKAFSGGMQEFIEAFTFYNYLDSGKILNLDYYQEKLNYQMSNDLEERIPEQLCQAPVTKICAAVLPMDFVLGVADVTGELMRKCINSLGEGNTQSCFDTRDFVRCLYAGFLTIDTFCNKEMYNKAHVLKQSLSKMEMVCYNIHVRGTEAYKDVLIDENPEKWDKTCKENDEGFFD